MSNVKTFTNDGFQVRTLTDENGEPLFCLADVCRALELTNPSKIASQIKEEFETPNFKLGVIQRETGPVEAIFITEPHLYFVMMRSRAERAKAFRRWITSEVLPSIRKTGSYSVKAQLPDFTNPAEAARAWASEFEAKTKAIEERDEAIRTKAWIGSKREATAMSAASKAIREVRQLKAENEDLKDRLGDGQTYHKVMGRAKLLKQFFNLNKVAYQQIGKTLSKLSKSLGYEVREVPDPKFDTVKAYHSEVWEAFLTSVRNDAQFLAKYRKAA